MLKPSILTNSPTGKTTAIRPIAVRKTDLSRHHLGSIEDPLNHHITIVLGGLREAPNCAPIMPRVASVSYSRCEVFLRSGFHLLCSCKSIKS